SLAARARSASPASRTVMGDSRSRAAVIAAPPPRACAGSPVPTWYTKIGIASQRLRYQVADRWAAREYGERARVRCSGREEGTRRIDRTEEEAGEAAPTRTPSPKSRALLERGRMPPLWRASAPTIESCVAFRSLRIPSMRQARLVPLDARRVVRTAS